MTHRRPLGVALLFAFSFGAVACAGPGRITVRLSKAELQERLGHGFPMEHNLVLASMRLEAPEVLLHPESELVGLTFRLRLRLGLQEYEGRVSMLGRIAYDAVQKRLYLREPQLRDLQVAGLSESDAASITSILNPFLATMVPRLELHRLDTDERVWLRDVRVHQGDLVLELGV